MKLLRVRWRNAAFSLSELLIVLLLAGLTGIAIYKVFTSTGSKSQQLDDENRLSQNMTRVVKQIQTDIAHAGSDPTRNALWAWKSTGSICDYLRFRTVGINPLPTKRPPDCLHLGDIEILSYNMYDANKDGRIAVDEGVDYVSNPPALKLASQDNVVWAFLDSDTDGFKESLYRINAGSILDDADDIVSLALDHLTQFDIRYFGIGIDGKYGDITSMGREDYIRTVQFTLTAATGKDIKGYTNPDLVSNHPFVHQRTKMVRFMASPKVQVK